MIRFALLFCLALPLASETGPSILIENVRIFDGVDAELADGHVLVGDGLIQKVSKSPIQPPEGAMVVDGKRRVLSPGFIDLHVHLTMQYPKTQETAC